MNDVLVKYNALSPEVQKEVNNFLDYMLSKHQNMPPFDLKKWKIKIKNISEWSDDDIKSLEDGIEQFKTWKTEEW